MKPSSSRRPDEAAGGHDTIALRHLPTAWNLEGRLQGRRDLSIALPDRTARLRILRIREELRNEAPFDTVLASGLKRSQETARLHGFPDFKVEPLMDELDFGDFEGQPKSKLEQSLGDPWRNAQASLLLGESLGDLQQRILDFRSKYPAGTRILLFGHGAWLRACVSLLRFGDLRAMNRLEIPHHRLLRLSRARAEPDPSIHA